MVKRKVWFEITILDEFGFKTLTYDIPYELMPQPGDRVQIAYNGFTSQVVSRTWTIRDEIIVRLQSVWVDPPEDQPLDGRLPWSLSLGDCSNELHSAGWES